LTDLLHHHTIIPTVAPTVLVKHRDAHSDIAVGVSVFAPVR
jgi:hypothetical protein